MNIQIFQVDAFTVKPFTGNPAAVCILEHAKDDAWMQAVAAEMNLSETAFLLPKGNGYHLRWFTPTTEVDLCGHATLASAHILYEFGFYEEDEPIEFFTRSGKLISRFDNGFIELDMPRRDPIKIAPPASLIEALGKQPVSTATFEDKSILAEYESDEFIRDFLPDFKKLSTLDFNDVVITARSEDPKYDVISRFFAPRLGINEDPVTGSVHCLLGPFWAEKLGKEKFLAYQASPRGGEVRVRLTKDRAFIGGKAITVLRGDLVHQ
jgi:PhzF family phenazine biosynthesis protein